MSEVATAAPAPSRETIVVKREQGSRYFGFALLLVLIVLIGYDQYRKSAALDTVRTEALNLIDAQTETIGTMREQLHKSQAVGTYLLRENADLKRRMTGQPEQPSWDRVLGNPPRIDKEG